MMGHERADGQSDVGKALKRRGLIAGAAALVAGIAAKQTSQPVAAAGLTLETTNMVIAGTTTITVAPGFARTVFEVDATAATSNVLYIDAIRARGQFNGAGVHAYGGNASANTGPGPGLQGDGGDGNTSGTGFVRDGAAGAYVRGGYGGNPGGNGGNGVQAYGGSAQSAGKRGGYGVYAVAGGGTLSGVGVFGSGDAGFGVEGTASSGTGVVGSSTTGLGIYGVTAGTGQVAGLYGFSSTAYGIIGNSTAAGYSGLTAISSTPNVAALGATATVPTAYAAFFTGTTVVNGNFVATGGTKSAAVKDASGQHRLVYCVESPESWFEDFGKAKLVNGKAEVTLDKTFSEIVHTDEYHVFVTTEGDFHAHVAKKTASGFTVQQTTGTGTGNASGLFSYRVVAKRKDIVGERLAKWEMPKINHPDPDKLPKPELPKKP